MKKRINRLLSLFLSLALLLGVLPGTAWAAENETPSITVQMTLYEKGEFAKDKDNRIMYQRPVTVLDENQDGTYSLDEALQAVHTAYYPDGSNGYATADSSYGGKMVTKLWGTETSDSGFCKNDAFTGTVDAESLEDGDRITAFTYYDTKGYSDRYSFFTESEKTVTVGEEFSLTLKSWGYDENWTSVQKPVAAAPIGAYDINSGAYSVPESFRGEKLTDTVYMPTPSTDTNGTVKFSILDPGTYYVTAQYNSSNYSTYNSDGSSSPNYLVPPVCKVTVQEAQTAPTSITIVSDDSNPALDGTLIGKTGDTFQFKALDQDGKETSVTWEKSSSCPGDIDPNTGVFTATGSLSCGGSNTFYLTATSTIDSSIVAKQSFSLTGYQFSSYQKTQSVALSADGQTAKTVSLSGGYKGHTIWSYDETAAAGIATLASDPGNGTSIKFNALRPGTFDVSFKLDLADSMTDTATVTITGVAVEDADSKQTKTYLSRSTAIPNPTEQLTAYCQDGRTVTSWSSANEAIATVDENGLVTAQGIGSTIITATDNEETQGGIQVVVTDLETPYFENIQFLSTAITDYSKNYTFSPTKLEYDLPIKNYSTSSLALQATTLFDAQKYTASAEYTDINGEKQSVTVNSGAVTTLPNQPFDNSDMTITLTDKSNSDNKTVYTFHVSRPRDTTKEIKSSGIVLVPDGRSLLSAKYKNYAEGTMLKADETGVLTSGTGVSSSQKYYRTYALNNLEKFSLTLTGNTAYTHLRYSADDGNTWTELPQGGGNTDKLCFPAEGEKVVKIQIQILDDKTYADNIKAGKDGFASGEPETYTIWVEQVSARSESAQILTAATESGDWYAPFNKDTYSYNIVVPNSTTQFPTVTYTVAEGATVKLGSTAQAANDNGNYTLPLKTSAQSLTITSADGSISNTYSFKALKKSRYDVPDKVTDYLCINSQYTNGSSYGAQPEATLAGSLKSLGNFGGYITYYYDTPLTDNPNNKYGVDFYVYGNANADTSTSTGMSFFEPGQVWVSENGETWYALAGSAHYEEDVDWNYTVTYAKASNGKTSWTDNHGNSNNGVSYAGTWPTTNIYYLNNLFDNDSITLSGVMLPAANGKVAVTGEATDAYAVNWGYADVFTNGTIGADVDPYLDNSNHKLQANGFDLAWAVDAQGNPVDVSNKAFHYVKVQTASNIWHSTYGDKSTEITYVVRTTPQENAVGETTAPTGVTITDGASTKTVTFTPDQQVYSVDLGDMKYVSIAATGTADDDNIYINNQRVASGTAATGFKVTKENGEKLVRIIVQNGDKEPVLYLLKLTSSATESSDVIENVQVNVSGIARQASTTDGKTYMMTVGHRIDSVGIVPTVASDVTYTVNGETPKDSYALSYGKNTFTLAAASADGKNQTVTLIITRENAPTSSGKNITVYFTLLGDENHGDNGKTHTYQETRSQLETWIPRTSYTVPAEATVRDVFEKALTAADIPWINVSGNYVSSVNGLAEFNNGPKSGWMYLLNGKHPGYGIEEQSLSNGDSIIFHYTDDYTKEEGSEKWSSGSSGSNSTTPSQEESKVQTTVTQNTDKTYTVKVTENDKEVTASHGVKTTLTDVPSGQVVVMVDSNGQETILKKSLVENGIAYVLIQKSAILKIKDAAVGFDDVAAGSWYADAVDVVSSHQLFYGTAERTFSPSGTMTRGMLVTVLYRLEDEPAGAKEASFSDVAAGTWYTDAVSWAAEEKIAQGYLDRFSPNDNITREQLVTMLYRYADTIGLDTAKEASLASYSDASQVSSYAQKAMAWAVSADLIQGRSGNALAPQASITRSEVSVIFLRLLNQIVK